MKLILGNVELQCKEIFDSENVGKSENYIFHLIGANTVQAVAKKIATMCRLAVSRSLIVVCYAMELEIIIFVHTFGAASVANVIP